MMMCGGLWWAMVFTCVSDGSGGNSRLAVKERDWGSSSVEYSRTDNIDTKTRN